MALRRIFSEQPVSPGMALRLSGDAANHVLRVLRLRRGETLVVFDGSGLDYAAEIAGSGRETVDLRVGAATASRPESPLDVTLLQGLCRGPRMDVVVQKATELGVTRIVPVVTSRGVVRLDAEHGARKREHWQRVALAAAEQSGRSRVPEVSAPVAFEDAVEDDAGRFATRLVLDPEGRSLRDMPSPRGPLCLLVGPEGGFEAEERRLAADRGFAGARLGPRILRTETAPLAALALLQFIAGDF